MKRITIVLQLLIFSSVKGCAFKNVMDLVKCNLDNIVEGVDFLGDIMNFQNKISNDLNNFNLSPIDPLIINHIDFDIKTPILRLIGYEEGVTIKHISNFHVDKFEIKGDSLTINITFPRLILNGSYDVNGEIPELFKIFGKGNFKLTLINLTISTGLRFEITPNLHRPLKIKSLHVTLKLQSIENKIEGLMGDDELCDAFNQCITSLGPRLLDVLWPDVADGVITELFKVIKSNTNLKDFKLFQRISTFQIRTAD